MVRAAIFDLDGVIVDSEALHLTTEVGALCEFGPEVAADDLVESTGIP